MGHPFLYTIEKIIFGNKANSTIRMYAIKIVSNFFQLIFHFTIKICFHSLLLNCFASNHFFVTYWEKTSDRPRRWVCQVYPFLRRHDPWASAILQKSSRGSLVSRSLTVNQVNSKRSIDWFPSSLLCTKVRSRCSLDQKFCLIGKLLRQLKRERAIMALECFWWGPSLDLLRDSRNGALWLEHCFMRV